LEQPPRALGVGGANEDLLTSDTGLARRADPGERLEDRAVVVGCLDPVRGEEAADDGRLRLGGGDRQQDRPVGQ
jgi:hypothetical protein